jgi:hypothetical protein
MRTPPFRVSAPNKRALIIRLVKIMLKRIESTKIKTEQNKNKCSKDVRKARGIPKTINHKRPLLRRTGRSVFCLAQTISKNP